MEEEEISKYLDPCQLYENEGNKFQPANGAPCSSDPGGGEEERRVGGGGEEREGGMRKSNEIHSTRALMSEHVRIQLYNIYKTSIWNHLA